MRPTYPLFILSMVAPLASAQATTLNMRSDQNSDGSLALHSVPEVGGQAVGPSNPLPVSGTFNAAVAGFAPDGNVQSITASAHQQPYRPARRDCGRDRQYRPCPGADQVW